MSSSQRPVYKSLTAQSLHYLIRPHEAPRRTPITGPAAWRGSDLATSTAWRHRLSSGDVDELDRALATAKASRRPMHALRAADFPLPTLTHPIAAWRREVADGRGFVLVQGFPVERWGPEDSAIAFYSLGLHLGIPGAQNPEGDLLGHIRDTGEDPRVVRSYKTATDLAYHCDAADLVGLLCLQTARRGGVSRIISSITVYNAMLAEHPELIDRLYEPFLFDTHGEAGLDYIPLHACRHAGGRLRTFWHSDCFRSSHELERAPGFDPRERAALDAYDAIALRPELYLDMELAKGDAQLLSNHTILHARTAFEDHPDPARKRHLLRLWISLESQPSLRERIARLRDGVPLLAALARGRIDRAVRGRQQRR
jgi:Taurine catabolism dioxygenase TauD, TfdA family